MISRAEESGCGCQPGKAGVLHDAEAQTHQDPGFTSLARTQAQQCPTGPLSLIPHLCITLQFSPIVSFVPNASSLSSITSVSQKGKQRLREVKRLAKDLIALTSHSPNVNLSSLASNVSHSPLLCLPL